MARAQKRGVMVARRDPEPSYGPAMRSLHPKWRLAVQQLFLTEGNQTAALRLAGYVGTDKSLTEMASRIFRDERVQAAIMEEYRRGKAARVPEMMGYVTKIASDPTEKAADRLRAAGMWLDRVDPVVTAHRIEVEHHVSDDERDVQHWHALRRLGAPADAFVARFGPNGVARVEAMVLAEEARRREIETPTIEVDYDEVQDA